MNIGEAMTFVSKSAALAHYRGQRCVITEVYPIAASVFDCCVKFDDGADLAVTRDELQPIARAD